jgi:glyoxalase-like protein
MSDIDHLVYATPDLNDGIERLASMLGVRATPGGQHLGRGTRNALLAIGPRSYIEIIGPDPDQPPPVAARWFGIDSLREPRIVTWAAGHSDLPGLIEEAKRQGIALGALGDGRRTRTDGVVLEWRYTDPRVMLGDGIVPFFIDWGRTPHPAVTAADAGTLMSLRGQHPNAEALNRMLQQLGSALHVTQATEPGLIATIRTRSGIVEIR